MKILTQHIENPNISDIKTYRELGGYASVEKALKTMTPETVHQEVKTSGLKGRGGAGFPTGMKWGFLGKNRPAYLLCNFDESEPGTFKDRYLMERNQHILIEGMILASYALGVRTAYIYIRGELLYILQKIEKALAQAYSQGFLGEKILGTDFSLDIYTQPGGGAYICGEETALIESLEGKRGNPRIKPPFPAHNGLWGAPTVVNNVETLATVPWIINNGGEVYAKIGTKGSAGTKLISASGRINKPGTYEIELGLPVEEFIYSENYCGGIKDGKKLKAVIAGGSSVPILPADLILKTTSGNPRLMSYESLAEGGFETGTMLGSGGFMVLDETVSVVENTLNLAHFYRHESCGQCSPCREGTGWMEKILRKFVNGTAKMKDIDLLYSISKHIEGNTICPLGDAAAWPVAAAIRHFRGEFEERVK